jgi:hypothetical protein
VPTFITQLSRIAFHTFFVGMATFGLLVALCGPAATTTILIFWGIGFVLVGVRHAVACFRSWSRQRRARRWSTQTHDADALDLLAPRFQVRDNVAPYEPLGPA